jgi:hypothetical protein
MVIPSKKLLLTNIVQVTQAGKTEPERIKYGTTLRLHHVCFREP